MISLAIAVTRFRVFLRSADLRILLIYRVTNLEAGQRRGGRFVGACGRFNGTGGRCRFFGGGNRNRHSTTDVTTFISLFVGTTPARPSPVTRAAFGEGLVERTGAGLQTVHSAGGSGDGRKVESENQKSNEELHLVVPFPHHRAFSYNLEFLSTGFLSSILHGKSILHGRLIITKALASQA